MITPPNATLRAFLALAWPIIVTRATQAVIGFSDAAMTAPLGASAFAAATAGSMNAMNLMILPMGVVFLVQSFASQLHGRGTPAAARRYAIYGLLFAGATEILLLAGLGAIGPATSLLEYEPAVRETMADYLRWRLAGIGAVIGTEALGNYKSGLGDTRTPMIANVVSMVTNIGLNAVLIYGYLGAPALGVRGAALASSIASTLGFLVLVVSFAREPVTRAARGALRASEAWRLLRFGLPNGLNWFLEFAAFMFFVNVIVAKLGTAAVGALLAVIQLNSLSFMPAFGCASAGAIFVGQAIGSGRQDWVPWLVRRTALVAGTWQVIVGIFYATFPTQVMAAFGASPNASPEIVLLGTTLLPLSALWQLFDALAMTLAEALRAAGDTVWTLGARIALAWVVFVPASWLWIRSADGGTSAAILCIVGYIGLLALFFYLRFRAGAWRAINLTGEPQLEA